MSLLVDTEIPAPLLSAPWYSIELALEPLPGWALRGAQSASPRGFSKRSHPCPFVCVCIWAWSCWAGVRAFSAFLDTARWLPSGRASDLAPSAPCYHLSLTCHTWTDERGHPMQSGLGFFFIISGMSAFSCGWKSLLWIIYPGHAFQTARRKPSLAGAAFLLSALCSGLVAGGPVVTQGTVGRQSFPPGKLQCGYA